MKQRRIGALLLVLALLLALHACGEGRVVELADYRALCIEPEAVEISDAYVDAQIQYMLGLYAQQDANGARIVPELTDEFVQENLGDASVEAYRERLRGILYEEARETVLESWKAEVIQALLDGSVLELDESEVAALAEAYRAQYEAYSDALALDWSDFCREYFDMSAQSFEELLYEQAREKLGGELLLDAIAADMQLELGDAQYQQLRQAFMEEYRLDEETLDRRYSEETLRRIFLEELVWERLLLQME